jgi:hypothetical protein
MLYNEFEADEFRPLNDNQQKLAETIISLRSQTGTPDKMQYLRSLARTRQFTRTVYPPGWKAE